MSRPSVRERYAAVRVPRTLLPAASSGGENVRERPLARRDRDHAPADAALAGQADVVQPVTGRLVHPGDEHRGERRPAGGQVDHPFTRARVHAPVGERRAHRGEVLGGHRDAALPGVELDGLVGVDGQRTAGVEELGQRAVAVVRGDRREVEVVVEGEPTARERRQARQDPLPRLRHRRAARDQRGGGDRARVDHGVGAAVRAALHGGERVEREPGGVHADAGADLVRAEGAAGEGEHERLGHAHDRERHAAVPCDVDRARHPHDGDAEAVRVRDAQCRVDVRHRALADRLETPVGLVDEPGDLGGLRQRAGGDERRVGRRHLRSSHDGRRRSADLIGRARGLTRRG